MQAIDPAGKIKSLLCDLWNNLKVLAHGQDGAGTSRPLLTDTGGRQVIVTAPPIEIRTNVGAVSAGATVNSDTIDLGVAASRQHTRLMLMKYGVASVGEVLLTQWSDDGSTWNYHIPGAFGSATTVNAYSNNSGAQMVVQGIPPGRYARIVFTNGSTPQTALLLAITAIAGL